MEHENDTFEYKHKCRRLVEIPDKKRELCTGTTLGSIGIHVDYRLSKHHFCESKSGAGIFGVCISHDRKAVFTGHRDGTIGIWRLPVGVTFFEGHQKAASSPTISQDAIISALISRYSYSPEAAFSISKAVSSLAYSQTYRLLISSGTDSTIRLWKISADYSSCHMVKELNDHSSPLISVAVSPCGKYFASGSFDKTIMLWNLEPIKCFKILAEKNGSEISSLAYSPTGQYIASGHIDNNLRLWHVDSGRLVAKFKGHKDKIQSVCFAPNSQRIFSGSYDKTIRIWNVKDKRCEQVLHGHDGTILSLACSPDGCHLASGGMDKSLMIWDLDSKKNIKKLAMGLFWRLLYSNDGKSLICVGTNSFPVIYDTKTYKKMPAPYLSLSTIPAVGISKDERYLSVGSSARLKNVTNILYRVKQRVWRCRFE